MGNKITIQSSGVLDTTTELGKFIHNWATDKNTNFYNTKPIDNIDKENNYTNILKKRACCTLNDIVKIPIADVVIPTTADTILNGKVIVKGTNLPPKLVSITTGIKVFNSTDEITSNACKFTNNSFLGTVTGKNKLVNIQDGSCGRFHANLCKNVLLERQYLKGEDKQYYGLYPQNNPSDARLTNPYIDCNCINSIFNAKNIQIKDGDTNLPLSKKDLSSILPGVSLDRDTNELAQNLDIKCYGEPRRAVKFNDMDKALCIQSAIVMGNVTIDKTGEFKQECKIDNKTTTNNLENNNKPPSAPLPPTGNNQPPTTGNNNPPSTGNNNPPSTENNQPPSTGNNQPPSTGNNNPPSTKIPDNTYNPPAYTYKSPVYTSKPPNTTTPPPNTNTIYIPILGDVNSLLLKSIIVIICTCIIFLCVMFFLYKILNGKNKIISAPTYNPIPAYNQMPSYNHMPTYNQMPSYNPAPAYNQMPAYGYGGQRY